MQKWAVTEAEPWVVWFNDVSVGIMVVCCVIAVFLPDLGLTLGTVGYLAGVVQSTADRPMKANLTTYASWLVFLVNAASLRRDTTRILQGICVVISFWQTFITFTWTLLLQDQREAGWEYWIAATAVAAADLYISTVYSDSIPKNEASLLLGAYVVSRSSGYTTRRGLVIGVAGTAVSLLLCSLSGSCLLATEVVNSILVAISIWGVWKPPRTTN